MLAQILKHTPIFFTVFFGVVSQAIIKWHMTYKAGQPPQELYPKAVFLITQLFNPLVMVALFLTLMSGISWMLAMSRFDISYAYSFLGLNFVITLFIGVTVFNEPILMVRIVGVALIAIGVSLVAKG